MEGLQDGPGGNASGKRYFETHPEGSVQGTRHFETQEGDQFRLLNFDPNSPMGTYYRDLCFQGVEHRGESLITPFDSDSEFANYKKAQGICYGECLPNLLQELYRYKRFGPETDVNLKNAHCCDDILVIFEDVLNGFLNSILSKKHKKISPGRPICGALHTRGNNGYIIFFGKRSVEDMEDTFLRETLHKAFSGLHKPPTIMHQYGCNRLEKKLGYFDGEDRYIIRPDEAIKYIESIEKALKASPRTPPSTSGISPDPLSEFPALSSASQHQSPLP